MIKVRTTEFEGTPEEFSKVAHLFGVSVSTAPQKENGSPEGLGSSAAVNDTAKITQRMVLDVLTRRRLSPNARKVLKVFLDAGPNHLTTTEIAKKVGIENAELAGVLGAFGRRVANTPGWPAGTYFFNYNRDQDEAAEWRYWLKETPREILASGQFKL